MMSGMDLAEFLLARIAEDELTRDEIHRTAPFECDVVFNARVDPTFGWTCTCGVPARVLAECEAKRRIVEHCRPTYAVLYRESERLLAHAFDQDQMQTVASSDLMWPHDGAEPTLRTLATVYADHPDYREEWRP